MRNVFRRCNELMMEGYDGIWWEQEDQRPTRCGCSGQGRRVSHALQRIPERGLASRQRRVKVLAYCSSNLVAKQIKRFFSGIPEGFDGYGDFAELYSDLNYTHLGSHSVSLSLAVLSRFQITRHQFSDAPRYSAIPPCSNFFHGD
jgi:hypothetical protein